jgi:hypothetical protein
LDPLLQDPSDKCGGNTYLGIPQFLVTLMAIGAAGTIAWERRVKAKQTGVFGRLDSIEHERPT